MKEYMKSYYIKNKERLNNTNKEYSIRNKDKIKEYYNNYKIENKEKIKEYFKNYEEENKEKIKQYKKDYYQKNKEKVKEHQKLIRNNKKNILSLEKEYRDNNKEKFINYRLKYRLNNPHMKAWRNILRNALMRLGKKKEGHTIDLLGYSALELKEHIEKLFTIEMSWDNYGEWHIDHIKPVISFNSNIKPEIVNSLDNLRPLWATTREINGVVYEGNLNREKITKNKI